MSEDYSKMTDNELIELYHKCMHDSEQYNVSQLVKKILLNSEYGASANNYFLYYNIDMARSITLMGQCMINKSAIETNKYISKCLKESEVVDRRVYSDTDSVNFDTQIYVNNDKIAIGDFYESSEGKETELPNGKFIKELPDSKYNTLTVDENDFTKAKETGIRYVMKHKTTKDLYKVKFKGKEITITADHSLIVKRNNKLIPVTVNDIRTTDEFIAME